MDGKKGVSEGRIRLIHRSVKYNAAFQSNYGRTNVVSCVAGGPKVLRMIVQICVRTFLLGSRNGRFEGIVHFRGGQLNIFS